MLPNVVWIAGDSSWPPLAGMSLLTEKLLTVLLVILPACLGMVLGVMSWNRREVKVGWIITVVGLNALMALTGLLGLLLV
jgi:hypothetical protein